MAHTHALFLIALSLAVCSPRLPAGSNRDGGPEPTSDGVPVVQTDPPADLAAVPAVVRLRVGSGGPANPPTSQLVLVRGSVGPAHLRELAKGEVSAAFAERIVPAIVWTEGDAVVLAPTVVLERGETYSVACGEPPIDVELTVADVDPAPVVARLWPPAGGSGTARLGIWCSAEGLPPFDVPASLSPGGPSGALRRGVVAGAGDGCVRFEAGGDETPDEGWIAPPALELDDEIVAALDPRPFSVDLDPPETESLACEAGELPFGPGCAHVADDRIEARAPESALLWAIRGGRLDAVLTTGPGDPFVVSSLPPLSPISFDVVAIDAAGRARRRDFEATTGAPRAHLILNEVLANPLGPEPAQEWVEIVNDGSVAADLAGYVLADGGGEAVLPPVSLAPSAYALVVNGSFVEDDGVDPSPAPGTTIVPVEKLGKNGLSNAGEPLELRDPDGIVLSRFPAVPKPAAGSSVARVRPTAPDGLATSFVVDEEGPTPGASNTH